MSCREPCLPRPLCPSAIDRKKAVTAGVTNLSPCGPGSRQGKGQQDPAVKD